MSAAELFEGIALFNDIALSALVAYLSVVSGYLAVAYIVGRKLSRLQYWTISTLFTTFTIMLAISVCSSYLRAAKFADELELMFPDDSFPMDAWIAYGALGVMLAGIAACLYFMHDSRR